MSDNSAAVQLYGRFTDPLAAIKTLGENLGKSTMLAFSKQEQGVVLAWECFATHLTPMQVMRRIHITTDGKFMMRADAMLAEYRNRGGKVKWIEHSPSRVAGEWDFEGNKTTVDYTIETATKAGYIKPNSGWTKDPEAQLQAACIRKAMRMLCPEVIVESGDPQEDYPAPAAELRMPAAAEKIITPAEFTPPASAAKPAVTEVTVPPAEQVSTPVTKEPEKTKPVAVPAGELSVDIQKKLAEIMGEGEQAAKAMAWFISKGHLKEGQHLGHLTAAMANQIINRTQSFWAAVNK